MAIETIWRVDIGTLASPSNFTDRVMSMNIRQSVDVNVIGRGQATITLLNKDGALTPGGGGTYSTTDWFAQGVYIKANSYTVAGGNNEVVVFHGVVVDFDLRDNGVFSTVTITAMDGLTVAAKTVGSTLSSANPYTTIYGNLVDRYGIVFPRLGKSNAEGIVSSEYGYTQPEVGINFGSSTIYPTTYADALQTYLIPSVNDVTWATDIVAGGGNVANYNIRSLGSTTTRQSTEQHTFEFDPSGAVTGAKLPFDNDGFTQAFNNDILINQAQVNGSSTGLTTQTSTNSSNTSYGNRTVQYLATLNTTDADALEVATRLTNRYSTVRFTPVSLRTSAKLVYSQANNAAQNKWAALLAIKDALWQQVKITWTGSGAASQTAKCIIAGRTINVTPSDTIVTLQLLNWYDNHGFILNEDELDYGRLG